MNVQAQSPVEPQRVCELMQTALEEMVRSLESEPTVALHRLNVVSASEQRQLLDWGATRASRPSPTKCIHELFEGQAVLWPESVAVVYEGRALTYGELNVRANRLAHYLVGLGVKPETRVAIRVERSLEMVIGLLAILKAGGVYVPLDPSYPAERLAYMIADSEPRVILTDAVGLGGDEIGSASSAAVVLDLQADAALWEGASGENIVGSGLSPEHLAYVIYTSGSTGAPKGVMVPHANVTRLFAATEARFHFDHEDVWTLFHSFAFDFSVWEIWGALAHGGRLVVVPRSTTRSPREFYELLVASNVTVLNQTPSAFRQLMVAQGESELPHRLRYVIFGGEALEVATLAPWYGQVRNRGVQLVNMYGITETTVHVTYRPLESADTRGVGASPIGRGLDDLKTYILDRRGRPVPIAW